jgi:hypothetical protein
MTMGMMFFPQRQDDVLEATLFELLYLFCPDEAQNIIYDNGCHLQAYMLNRAPAWSKDKRVFIDQAALSGAQALLQEFQCRCSPHDSRLSSYLFVFQCSVHPLVLT